MLVPTLSSFSSSIGLVPSTANEAASNSVEDACSFLVSDAGFKGWEGGGSSLKFGRIRFLRGPEFGSVPGRYPPFRGRRRAGIRPLSFGIFFSFGSASEDAGVVATSLYPLVSLTGAFTSNEDDSSETDEDGDDSNSLVDIFLVSASLPGMRFK